MRAHTIITAATALCTAAIAQDIPQFHNSARHTAADPYVIYDAPSGLYYAYSTEGADSGSLFGIYSSPDLSTWHKHPSGVLKACYDSRGQRVEGGQACWARDWHWAPETYYNNKTGWYFFFFAGRLQENLAKDYFRFGKFDEPSKIGVAVSRSPTGPFVEIEGRPVEWFPFDPAYHDVNLVMDERQMLPPRSLAEGQRAPKGTFIPTIDANILFDTAGRIYLYASRNAYRNWNWDARLGKYIEESNIIVVELERGWWDDPTASTMPEIIAAEKNVHAKDAPKIPCSYARYNGTGEIGRVPRKDGWKTVISYGADPQDWENYHVDDYAQFNGNKKDRRWSEGSTVITRSGPEGKPVYVLLYSANNFEASNYGIGYATAASPLGPFKKASQNPVLSQLPDAEVPIYSTGHGSIVASPARDGTSQPGAQDFMWETPAGSELFYVHHGRNSTEAGRTMYTTRMTLNEETLHVGSNDAISMDLTPLDQPLPLNTYPIKMTVKCAGAGEYTVGVYSKQGAPFDITEGTNRVVAVPGEVAASSMGWQNWDEDGSFVLGFEGEIEKLVYQRLSVRGGWETVVEERVSCPA